MGERREFVLPFVVHIFFIATNPMPLMSRQKNRPLLPLT